MTPEPHRLAQAMVIGPFGVFDTPWIIMDVPQTPQYPHQSAIALELPLGHLPYQPPRCCSIAALASPVPLSGVLGVLAPPQRPGLEVPGWGPFGRPSGPLEG
jgi:hypothetical protein